MSRFNEINVDSMYGAVEVGAGLTWDQVYATLGQIGVNVVGGRVPGVGVAGLTLGGGECLPSSLSSISYSFRLFISVESIWTCGRQCRWI